VVGRAQREGLQGFPFGLYHLAAGGETTWYDYARFVINQVVAAGKIMKVAPNNIHPITTDDYPLPAKRPANSRLNTSLIRNTFDLELPDWQHGVNHVLQQIL